MRIAFSRHQRSRLAPLLVVGLCVVFGGASFSVAHAAQAAPGTSIHLSQTTGWVNSQVIISGLGYGEHEQINIFFDGTVVATAQTELELGILGEPLGRFSITVSIPLTATPGAHVVKAMGQTSGRSAQTSFFVAPSWTQFRYDAAHTGFNPFESTLSPANVVHLTTVWINQLFRGTISSSPAVANGLVYIGADGIGFHALDPYSGIQAWSVGGAASSPATTDTEVFVSDNEGGMGALDAATGKGLWGAVTDNFVSLLASPAFANGVVYIASSNDLLYAFNATGCGQVTCNPLWYGKVQGNGFLDTPAIANGVVYAGGGNGNVYAFSTSMCGANCAPLWQGTTGGAIDASPAIANKVLYIGAEDDKFYAFAASGCGSTVCSPLWSATTGGAVESSAAIANGVVYVGSDDGKLYAFNASGCGHATCTPLWTAATGGALSSSPAVANGVVYIGSQDGKLYAFNAAGCGSTSCAPLWSYQTGGPIISSPAVTDGMVFVGSNDQNVYAFGL